MARFPLQSNSYATMNQLPGPHSGPCKDMSFPLQLINEVNNETVLPRMSHMPLVWIPTNTFLPSLAVTCSFRPFYVLV